MLAPIKNDQEYDETIDYLRAVEKIEIPDMSKAMFKFLRAAARAARKYLSDVCCIGSAESVPMIDRFLFKPPIDRTTDPRSFYLLEHVHKKQWEEERAKWVAGYLANPIDLENF